MVSDSWESLQKWWRDASIHQDFELLVCLRHLFQMPKLSLSDVTNSVQLLHFPAWQCSTEFSKKPFGFSTHTGEHCTVYACFHHYYIANSI